MFQLHLKVILISITLENLRTKGAKTRQPDERRRQKTTSMWKHPCENINLTLHEPTSILDAVISVWTWEAQREWVYVWDLTSTTERHSNMDTCGITQIPSCLGVFSSPEIKWNIIFIFFVCSSWAQPLCRVSFCGALQAACAWHRQVVKLRTPCVLWKIEL